MLKITFNNLPYTWVHGMYFRNLEGQFELNENNEVSDRGGEHVGQSTPGDLKQAAPRDWLGVVDDVHDLLYLGSILQCQLGVVQPKESDVLETSIKCIHFETKHFYQKQKCD